jgi:hypothetical protein
MAITYKSAGAGVSTQTSAAALSPQNPATVDAGDILLLFTAWENTTIAPAPDATWVLLSGPLTTSGSVSRVWLYGKIADGTEDAATNALGSPASTDQRAARIFSFAGRTAGDIGQLVTGITSNTGATDPTGPTVTTTLAGALACAMVFQNDNNTLETFAGSSDTWTERGTVGGFIYALTPGGVLDLLTATPAADPGTVSGGAMTVTDDPWTVIGFQILPNPVPLTDSCPVVATEGTPAIEAIGLLTKTATDSCAVQASDTAVATIVLNVGLPLIIGTETAAVTLRGVYADDSCRIVATEGTGDAAQSAFPSASEACAIQCAEVALVIATVTGTDSCVVQGSETATISSSVVASDSCAIQCAEVLTGSSTLSASDSGAIQASEAATVLITFTVTDSCAVQLADLLSAAASESHGDTCAVRCDEAAAIVVVLSVTDSCAVIAGDVGSQQLVEGDTTPISASDSVAVQLSEVLSSLMATVSATDSAVVQAAESTSIISTVSASDAAAVALAETVSIAVVLTASDSCAIQASEDARVTSVVVASDSCAVQADEVVTTVTVTLSATDAAVVVASETAALASTSSASDSCAIVISTEATSLSITSDATAITASDTCAIRAVETVTPVSATSTVDDSTALQATETVVAAVSASATADLALRLTEDLRGDSTASYADSIAVIADDVTVAAGEFIEAMEISVTDALPLGLDDLATAPVAPAEEVALMLLEEVTLVQTELQGFWGGGWLGEPALIPYGEGQLLDQPRDLPKTGDTW